MKNIIYILVFLTFSLNAQQLAFPDAKGSGAYTTGSRGGQVIHVTTLVWDAVGGLKEAIQTTGARTIVFDVSGEIDATSQAAYSVLINGSTFDNLTIAGQTAPNGGISVRTSSFIFQDVDNIIVRYVRFRGSNAVDQDAISILGGTNIIFDHCSFSHGWDEAGSFANSSGVMGDVTIQNCFFQDSKTGSILAVDNVIGNFTFINNLYSGVSHRFPNPKGDGQYDIINNVVYNWKERLIRITGEGTYNVTNNYYKPSANGLRLGGWFGDGNINNLQKLQAQLTDSPIIYTAGNIVTGQRDTPLTDDSDMWEYFAGSDPAYPENDPVSASFFTSTPFALKGESFTIKTANQAYTDVLANVGANKTLNADGTVNSYSDTKDAADLLMVQNDTYSGSFYDAISTIPYPTVPNNTRPVGYDTDLDGIPDTYETAKGWNPNAANDNVVDGSGYTQLELFLNEVDDAVVVPPTPPIKNGNMSLKTKRLIISN